MSKVDITITITGTKEYILKELNYNDSLDVNDHELLYELVKKKYGDNKNIHSLSRNSGTEIEEIMTLIIK